VGREPFRNDEDLSDEPREELEQLWKYLEQTYPAIAPRARIALSRGNTTAE
jgi:hypothetical protein